MAYILDQLKLFCGAENLVVHEGNTKFNTKNEEWVTKIRIILCVIVTTFFCTSFAIKYIDDNRNINKQYADLGGPAVEGAYLKPLHCWDRRFESS
jgi:hypothetical protein